MERLLLNYLSALTTFIAGFILTSATRDTYPWALQALRDLRKAPLEVVGIRIRNPPTNIAQTVDWEDSTFELRHLLLRFKFGGSETAEMSEIIRKKIPMHY
jgi:hypothetical protein